MIFVISIYDESGTITRHAEGPDPELLAMNVGDGEGWVPGHYDPDAYYIDAEGEPQPLPPKPGPWAQWDGAEWIDPRNPADLEAELQALRDAAWLNKTQFLLACMESGLLDPAGTAMAGRGDIPPQFQDAYDALDPMMKDYLDVIWPTATRIERMDPFIQAIAAERGLSDELVDQLFGIETSWQSPSNIL